MCLTHHSPHPTLHPSVLVCWAHYERSENSGLPPTQPTAWSCKWSFVEVQPLPFPCTSSVVRAEPAWPATPQTLTTEHFAESSSLIPRPGRSFLRTGPPVPVTAAQPRPAVGHTHTHSAPSVLEGWSREHRREPNCGKEAAELAGPWQSEGKKHPIYTPDCLLRTNFKI